MVVQKSATIETIREAIAQLKVGQLWVIGSLRLMFYRHEDHLEALAVPREGYLAGGMGTVLVDTIQRYIKLNTEHATADYERFAGRLRELKLPGLHQDAVMAIAIQFGKDYATCQKLLW